MKKTEIRDLLKYRFPENLQYSPDGETLAFQVAYADEEKNCYQRDVHIIKGGKDIQLTATMNAGIVLWDNDEELILQRSTEATKPDTVDYYKINIHGGEAKKWLTLPMNITAMKKIDDGTYAALATILKDDPDAYKDDEETRKTKAEKKKKEKDYEVFDEVPYWMNGSGIINQQRTALFVIQTDPLVIRRITDANFDIQAWHVDKDTVYYAGNQRKIGITLYTKLYSYNVREKKKTTLYNKNDRVISSIFTRDNRLYVQETDMKEYGVNETCHIAEVKDGNIIELLKPEVSLYNSVAGDTLLGGGKGSAVSENEWLTIATEADHSALYGYDRNFNQRKIFDKGGNIAFFDVSDEKIACVYQDSMHLPEVFEMDRDGQNFRKLTALNEAALKDTYIAKPHVIRYKSQGTDLKGWTLLPENFNPKKKYPAILDVHGGPRTIYSDIFFHEMQVWAAKGFVVFFTNIRGSDGRGDEFADIRGEYGYVDYLNLMDFTDAVLEEYPNIDIHKLCETGGSYGGFMSNWIIGHTDRFCAVVSQRSISNWISMSHISDIGLYFGPDQCGASGLFGEKNYEMLWEHSPLKYADRVHTSTLFIHSDEDYRCPLPEGMQMMQALAARNIETRMVVFHGENHELSRSGKPVHRIRRLEEITKWFEDHTR